MITAALLSTPGSRRRIPCPIADPPTKWVWLENESVKEISIEAEDFPSSLHNLAGLGFADATPHRPAGEKLALANVVLKKVNKPHVWEGATPPSKRSWIHMESVVPAATPQVVWGCTMSEQFPGEGVLIEDECAAKKHLYANKKLMMASGHPHIQPCSDFVCALTALELSAVPHPPPPGLGIGFFSWIKSPMEGVLEAGPIGRGWGRIGEDARKSYHLTNGRNDPGMLCISGFVYATTEGSISFNGASEASSILAGISVIEKARYTANVVVESVQSFKAFTLLRAVSSQCRLPDWLLYPPGRCWLSGLSRFAPRGEDDPHSWIMRTAVSCGEKTCSKMIPEPGAPWIQGLANPGMAAKSTVSALVKSPYFQLGPDPAPDLLSRGESTVSV